MENGKVVDTEALTRYCRGCKVAENFRISDPARYDLWKAEHICLRWDYGEKCQNLDIFYKYIFLDQNLT